MPYNSFIQTKKPMKVNGYEIKPGAYLYGANLYGADLTYADLRGANLIGANVKGTILEGKEKPSQDTTSLSEKVKELEEENKKLKDTLKAILTLLDT